MRYAMLAGPFAVLISGTPALAQTKAISADPAPCPASISDIATCYGAKHESGAYLLAALPKTWNGHLIVFAHGGPAVVPPTATTSQSDLDKYAAFTVKRGFAWVASSYRREGYGVRMAAEDSNDARKFFIERIAKPQRTILHGASYGGLVGAKLIETLAKNPDGSANFDGALFNSGFVVGAAVGHEFRADLRAVYQYYCKNLPRPDEAQYPLWMGIPASSKMAMRDLQALIDECTGIGKDAGTRTDLQKQNLANILGVVRIPDALLVRHMQAGTFLFREIADRITQGRSAFSNIGVQYKGSTDDDALNRGVARFGSDPDAVAALKADGSPTGALQIPVLSIHSINDPQVAVEVQSAYRDTVRSAGNGDRLVQAYTDEKGHTAQSAPELAAALDAVMQWIEKGTKPMPQAIAAACAQLRTSLEGRCSYHPEFEPKPYGTRYARGAAMN
jgi:hypothetical protein